MPLNWDNLWYSVKDVNSAASGPRPTEFHFLAVWPWSGYTPSLGLIFLICIMGIITVATHWIVGKIKYVNMCLKKEVPRFHAWYKGGAVQPCVFSSGHHYCSFEREFPHAVLLQDEPLTGLQTNPELAHQRTEPVRTQQCHVHLPATPRAHFHGGHHLGVQVDVVLFKQH